MLHVLVDSCSPSPMLLHPTRRFLLPLKHFSTRPMTTLSLRNTPATADQLAELTPSWTVAPSLSSPTGSLSRTLKFQDFSAAWGFMSRVALAAEKLNVRRA